MAASAPILWRNALLPPSYPIHLLKPGIPLDRSLFNIPVILPALRMEPRLCGHIIKNFRGDILARKRQGAIVADVSDESTTPSLNGMRARDSGSSALKLVLLSSESLPSECTSVEQIQSLTLSDLQLAQRFKEYLESLTTAPELIVWNSKIGFDYWTTDELLRSMLPEEDFPNIVTSFERVGHIAHMNLNDDLLPFKEQIGEIILAKNKGLRTVVRKTGNIQSTFRFFEMELLVGEADYVATVKENGCSFTFDYRRVYWNSRLGTEHERLINMMNTNDVVLDMFAGVGPFSLPLAKKGCTVYANDLNPESYSSMIENIKSNGMESGDNAAARIHCFNMDARDFVRQIITNSIAEPDKYRMFNHVVMNLPATAIEFLDVFRGLFRRPTQDSNNTNIVDDDSGSEKHRRLELEENYLPWIHCHCFGVKDDPTHEDLHARIENALGASIRQDKTVVVYDVRNIAPLKEMWCVSFRLPAAVAYATSVKRSASPLYPE